MKTKNKFIVLILMITLLLILKCNTVSAVTIDDTSNFRLVTSNLNLRSGASTSYSKILTIPADRTIKYLGSESNNFIKVSYNGSTGWVSKDYVKAVSNASPRLVIADALNLRTGPSTSYEVITKISQNAIVTYWGNATSDFAEVSYNGTIGWVSRSYLSVVSDTTNNDTSTNVSTSNTNLRLVTASSLNFRSGPSTNSSVIDSLQQYESVEYKGVTSNGFAKVSYNGTLGWVSATYLARFDCTDITSSSRFVFSAVNFRSAPSTSSSKYRTLPKGETITYLGEKQESDGLIFAKVTDKFGVTGWVWAKCLSDFNCDITYATYAHTNAPGSSAGRKHNIELASKTLSTTVIRPGESFSALDILGECNKEQGYQLAPVLVNGETEYDYGGGVCQVSTTINMAVKKLGIKTKAYLHSNRVSYATPEDEAAISYSGGKDLTFTNTLSEPIMLKLVAQNGNCACIVYILNTK